MWVIERQHEAPVGQLSYCQDLSLTPTSDRGPGRAESIQLVSYGHYVESLCRVQVNEQYTG